MPKFIKLILLTTSELCGEFKWICKGGQLGRINRVTFMLLYISKIILAVSGVIFIVAYGNLFSYNENPSYMPGVIVGVLAFIVVILIIIALILLILIYLKSNEFLSKTEEILKKTLMIAAPIIIIISIVTAIYNAPLRTLLTGNFEVLLHSPIQIALFDNYFTMQRRTVSLIILGGTIFYAFRLLRVNKETKLVITEIKRLLIKGMVVVPAVAALLIFVPVIVPTILMAFPAFLQASSSYEHRDHRYNDPVRKRDEPYARRFFGYVVLGVLSALSPVFGFILNSPENLAFIGTLLAMIVRCFLTLELTINVLLPGSVMNVDYMLSDHKLFWR